MLHRYQAIGYNFDQTASIDIQDIALTGSN